MPLFHYKAKKGATETVTGEIDARSQHEAVELIHQRGLVPVSVLEHRYDASPVRSGLPRRTVSSKELYIFSRQLANLIKAGVSLLRALEIIREQTHCAPLKDVITAVHQRIKDGQALSDCLREYPQLFSPLYVAMVRAGEEGGNLKEMLFRLADYQRGQQELLAKVRGAMAYPVFMLVVGLATVFFILTNVMPRLSDLFTRTGQQLPAPTIVVIYVSNFLKAGWVGVLSVLFAMLAGLKKWSVTHNGRQVLSVLALRLPLFGELTRKAQLTRFCRTLELLLTSGIPLQRSIGVAVPIVENERIRRDLAACQKDLEAGSTLGASLRRSSVVPALMANLIGVGEESGSLEGALHDIADGYEQETGEIIKTISTLIEPLMILIVGLVVGFVVIAMLLPVFQMDILAR